MHLPHQIPGQRTDPAAHQLVAFGTGEDLIDDEARQIGILRHKIEVASDTVAQTFGQWKSRFPKGRKHGLAHQLQFLVENPFEKLFLRAKIVVEHGVRNTCRLGNRSGPSPFEALGKKLLFGSTEDGILPIMKRFGHDIRTNKQV